MPRPKGAIDKHHARLMPRTLPVTKLKHTITENPGLTISQVAARLRISESNVHSLLVSAEAQGLLLAQSHNRPARLYVYRDLTDVDPTPPPTQTLSSLPCD